MASCMGMDKTEFGIRGTFRHLSMHLTGSPPQTSANVDEDAVMVKPARMGQFAPDLLHSFLRDRPIDPFNAFSSPELVLRMRTR